MKKLYTLILVLFTHCAMAMAVDLVPAPTTFENVTTLNGVYQVMFTEQTDDLLSMFTGSVAGTPLALKTPDGAKAGDVSIALDGVTMTFIVSGVTATVSGDYTIDVPAGEISFLPPDYLADILKPQQQDAFTVTLKYVGGETPVDPVTNAVEWWQVNIDPAEGSTVTSFESLKFSLPYDDEEMANAYSAHDVNDFYETAFEETAPYFTNGVSNVPVKLAMDFMSGAGYYDVTFEKLDEGKWTLVFPEGTFYKVSGTFEETFYTPIKEMTFHYTVAAETPVGPVVEEGKAYQLRVLNCEATLYLKVVPGSENSKKDVVLGETPQALYFTNTANGYTITTVDGLYVGGYTNTWNMSATTPEYWSVEEYENGYILKCAQGYLGFDANSTSGPSFGETGCAAYRDKNFSKPTIGIFAIEDYEATGVEELSTLHSPLSTPYNLQGQRLQTSGRGVSIVGGKKIIR